MSEHYLKTLFDPASIVLIGASETQNTQAATVTMKLHQQFTGKLYFVNPRHQKILDYPCYKKIKYIEASIDLAVVVSPRRTVEKVIRQCAEQGITHVVVMTYFPTRYRAEVTKNMKSLSQLAKTLGIRLLGPSAFALIRPSLKLNASVSTQPILQGKLALVSRSSTICNSIIDWAQHERVGFSAIISYGGGVDVDLADILDFLANDYHTNSIIVYLNHIHDTRRFMSALRAASKVKPVIILKSAHDNGSYSDVLTRIKNVHVMHEIFLAAVLRAGADYVSSLSNLFAAAKILGKSQRAKGNRLAVVSNGYGPIMLANDRVRDLGIETTHFDDALVGDLNNISNDINVLENAVVVLDNIDAMVHYVDSIRCLLAEKNVDAIMVIFAPSALVDGNVLATAIVPLIKRANKPVLTVWLGSDAVGKGRKILVEEGISNYRTPESAMDAFSFLCNHLANRQRLLQVPFPLEKKPVPKIDKARELIQESLANKNIILSKAGGDTLLDAFYIKRRSSTEISTFNSSTTCHLLKVCILNDPDFGPVISLGFDGVLSITANHSAVQLPPLNRRLSEELINLTPVSAMLNTYGDLAQTHREALRDLLIRVSEIAIHLPEIFELTLSAVHFDSGTAYADGTQVVLQKSKQRKKLFSHLAIHPYPSDWHRHVIIKDNQAVEVRPIRAEDAQAEIKFIGNMSKEAKYFRFMYVVNALTPEMLSNFTQMDYDREMAFGAFIQKGKAEVLLGESRYAINPDKKSCEFSIIVDDNYQGMGLARQLMLILIEHIKDHDLEVIEGTVLKNNRLMDKLMLSLGFNKRSSQEDHDINIYSLKYHH